ncbi:hypothetical protein LABALGNA3A7_16450 [Dellaglioa algida]|nr:hypothetical protein LABALGNA3A7_16450 [Dellaglioa algida]
MKFYKVLNQKKEVKNYVYKNEYFLKKFKSMIVTEKSSFAVEYVVDRYNDILSDEVMYSLFLKYNLTQVIMTNHKYMDLISIMNNKDIRVVQVLFDEDLGDEDNDFQKALRSEQTENIIVELERIMEYLEISVSKVVFRDSLENVIEILSNGVIGIDEEYLDRKNIVTKVIEVLNCEGAT